MESLVPSQMNGGEVLVSGCGGWGVGSGITAADVSASVRFAATTVFGGSNSSSRPAEINLPTSFHPPHPTPHPHAIRGTLCSPHLCIARSVCTNQNMSDSIYRRLEVWRESVQLAIETYTATQDFPRHELYGLSSQMRRAAVSIPSNIAEGRGRGTKRDFCRFVLQARGSLFELQTQITIAEALGYTTPQRVETLTRRSETVVRLLNGLVRYLQQPDTKAPTPHPPLPTPT